MKLIIHFQIPFEQFVFFIHSTYNLQFIDISLGIPTFGVYVCMVGQFLVCKYNAKNGTAMSHIESDCIELHNEGWWKRVEKNTRAHMHMENIQSNPMATRYYMKGGTLPYEVKQRAV